MNTYAVHSAHCSHLGFVTAATVDEAMCKAEQRWHNAYSVRHCPNLDNSSGLVDVVTPRQAETWAATAAANATYRATEARRIANAVR